MMFTDNPCGSLLTEEQLLGRKIVVLNKKSLKRFSKAYPFICIGQWLSVASPVSGRIDIEAIFVSPTAHVSIVLPNHPSDEDLPNLVTEFSSWDFHTLDRIAADFSFRTMGQAFCVRDIMAERGYVTFSQVDNLNTQLTACLHSGEFSLLGLSEDCNNYVH